MAKQTKGPARSAPLDGLKPIDFVLDRNWPHGAPTGMRLLRERGLSKEAADLHMQAILGLRQLAMDYDRYLTAAGTTQEAFAVKVGISANRLSALRTGASWPSWRVQTILRLAVPSAKDLQSGNLG